jgi:hypothetical protein
MKAAETETRWLVERNLRVTRWSKETLTLIIDEIPKAGIDATSDTIAKVKFATRKEAGRINSISFKFPRHLVFVHKGVSRGYTISPKGSGTVVRTAKGPMTKPRVAKPFLNQVLEAKVPDLSQTIADMHAKRIASRGAELLEGEEINATRMFIL